MVDYSQAQNLLLDPCNDRVVSQVKKPPRYPMTKEMLYHYKGNPPLSSYLNLRIGDGDKLNKSTVPDAALMREHLLIEGHITKPCLVKVLRDVIKIFSKYCRPILITLVVRERAEPR